MKKRASCPFFCDALGLFSVTYQRGKMCKLPTFPPGIDYWTCIQMSSRTVTEVVNVWLPTVSFTM